MYLGETNCSGACFRSEYWHWIRAIWGSIQGWETKGYEASDQIRKDEPRILCEDSEGGNHDLENETSLLLRNGSRMHVEDSGLDMEQEAKCGVDDTEIR